ncbi:MAG: YecA family protein [Gammaproteobacteria bacterium]|nr:YecA family protein [Gammaproteobacteria bacterium]
MSQSRASSLESLLLQLGSSLPLFEFHGTVCGIASSRGVPPLEEWPTLLGIVLDPNNRLHTEAVAPLLLELRAIEAALAEPMLTFTPLLPEDSADLKTRMTALSQWCQGFTLGLSSDERFRPELLSAVSRELIDDLLDISRLDETTLLDGDDEADEQALEEIIEYVRMGVLALRDELLVGDSPPLPGNKTLH